MIFLPTFIEETTTLKNYEALASTFKIDTSVLPLGLASLRKH